MQDEDFNTYSWALDSEDVPLLKLANSNQVVGTAINGVLLFTGTNDQGFDPIFPKSFGSQVATASIVSDLDTCLGTARTF